MTVLFQVAGQRQSEVSPSQKAEAPDKPVAAREAEIIFQAGESAGARLWYDRPCRGWWSLLRLDEFWRKEGLWAAAARHTGTLQLSEGVEVRGPVLEVGWAGESAPTRQLPCFDMALFYLSPIRAPCLQSVRVNFTSLVKCASCGNAYCSEKYLRMHPRLVRL